MRCVSCGTENAPGNKFCGECAAPLSLACASCGASLTAGQKFCGQCATPVAGSSAPATATSVLSDVPRPAAAPASENRQVSVVFIDLVGFTSLSESRDAEDVREILSRYFDTARTIIGRYGGVVEKFIGDAVMAVWGAPAAREDDAERAVRAALDVVEGVQALGAEVGVPLTARGGVVTGSVSAWTAPGEGLVAGDRVNTASRVQSVAQPGTVYVDENTRRTTSAAIAYSDAGEHTVKGKSEPLHLWSAERVIAGVGGSQRVDGLEARFIGRDADLRLVKELFHACIDRNSARLVSVVGVAGVGKSRLRWEFDKYVDGLADTMWYHTGRCLSYGDGVAYAALAEMVRQRFQVAEEDPAEVAAQRLHDGLPEFVPDAAEREFLLPRLGALLGVSDATLGREELFAGWRLLFERLADIDPVVLSFEDMQWADSGLIDFIEHLLDWAADSPIFIITFARPELAEARPGWPTGRRNATSLYLEPLSDADMAALLDDLVTDLPEALRARIVERAEGIPLYAVETVRSLIDRDVVVPKDGVYRVVGDVGDLDVPATLTSLIAARIDALPAEERSLIKDLAVVRGGFGRATAAALCSLDETTLDGCLADLVRKEFLSVRTDKLSPDRGQYVFAQSLLRTVAYEMLSRRERKARHLAVAAHLRSTFENDGEDVSEVIAVHYRDALLAAEQDPDAGDIRREALTAYGRAGRRAAALGAPDTALGIYKAAAELADDVDERLDMLERAAEMALQSGRHQETLDLYTQVRAEHEAAGHALDAARLAVGVARGHARLGRPEDAVETLKAALPVLDDGTYSPTLADVAGWLAQFLVFAGHVSDAEPYTEKALVVAQALGLPEPLCQALVTRATALLFLDRAEEALIHMHAAIDLSRLHDLPAQEENALIGAADMAMTLDRPDAADLARVAMALSQRRGNRYGESVGASNLLYALLYRDQWVELERIVAELVEAGGPDRPQVEFLHARVAAVAAWRGDVSGLRTQIAKIVPLRESANIDDICTVAVLDAMLARLEGRPEEALQLAKSVVDRMRDEIPVAHETMRLGWVEAMESALDLGDPDTAAQLLRRISGLPAGFVPPYLRAEAARFGARLAAARGEDAEPLFTSAEEQLRALGYRYWLSRAQLDHGEWLAGRDPEAASALGAAAADTFSDLGATSYLARARALMAIPAPV